MCRRLHVPPPMAWNSLSAEESDTTFWLTLHVPTVCAPIWIAPEDVDLHVCTSPLRSPSVQTVNSTSLSWFMWNMPM